MRKIIYSFIAILLANVAVADDTVTNDIIARFNTSLGKAKSVCMDISADIGKVKTMAGIGIGAGAVGTVAGGVAVATGIMKSENDKQIAQLEAERKRLDSLMAASPSDFWASVQSGELKSALVSYDNQAQGINNAIIDAAKNKSNTLGNVRTAGAFVSGAGGVVGAATSFAGLKTLDDLIANMNACDLYVREIDRQAAELRLAAPDDASPSKMQLIADSCKGMNSKNIADVKDKMKAAGILSVVGAVAGITGGVTSAVAVSKEKQGASATGAEGRDSTKGLNMAANISSGVAAVGNLGGAILSGVTLAGLIKNGDIAEKCKNAL